MVCFRDPKLRSLTYVPVADGPTLYITSSMQGSRNGAIMAVAWVRR